MPLGQKVGLLWWSLPQPHSVMPPWPLQLQSQQVTSLELVVEGDPAAGGVADGVEDAGFSADAGGGAGIAGAGDGGGAGREEAGSVVEGVFGGRGPLGLGDAAASEGLGEAAEAVQIARAG